MVTPDTLSTGARKLAVPPSTLRSWEARGIIGPFQRDAVGRRLLSAQDLEDARRYIESRK